MEITVNVFDDDNQAARPATSRRSTVATRMRTLIASSLVVAVLVVAGAAVVALARGSWSVYPVVSGSMRPGFALGGVAISERVPVSSLAVSDVIVFRHPDGPPGQVMRRIIKISPGGSSERQINTRSDANTLRDPWTLTIRGDFVYRVRWTLPLIGYAAVAYSHHRGGALLIVGVAVIVFAVVRIFKRRRSPWVRYRERSLRVGSIGQRVPH